MKFGEMLFDLIDSHSSCSSQSVSKEMKEFLLRIVILIIVQRSGVVFSLMQHHMSIELMLSSEACIASWANKGPGLSMT